MIETVEREADRTRGEIQEELLSVERRVGGLGDLIDGLGVSIDSLEQTARDSLTQLNQAVSEIEKTLTAVTAPQLQQMAEDEERQFMFGAFERARQERSERKARGEEERPS